MQSRIPAQIFAGICMVFLCQQLNSNLKAKKLKWETSIHSIMEEMVRLFFFSNKEIQYKSQLHSTGLKMFLYFTLGIVKLQINTFCAADVGTYECVAKNDYGEMTQPIIVVMAQYPEFIKSPNEVNLIGVNGGKVECEIFGVPKPKVTWFKDYHPLKETFRVQAYHYPPQVNIIVYISLLDNATNYLVGCIIQKRYSV